MRISFTPQAWEDYLHWSEADKKTVRKINGLLKQITRTPFEGDGKPEPLRHELAGFWSRRITGEHRLVYRVDAEGLLVVQCRYHYERRG